MAFRGEGDYRVYPAPRPVIAYRKPAESRRLLRQTQQGCTRAEEQEFLGSPERVLVFRAGVEELRMPDAEQIYPGGCRANAGAGPLGEQADEPGGSGCGFRAGSSANAG